MALKQVDNLYGMLDEAWATGERLMVWGPPGVGKTASIHAYAKRHGIPCYTIIGSQMDPTDVGGIPVPDRSRKQVDYYLPYWIKEVEEAGRGIIFLDEFNAAPPSVQAALHSLVNEKRIRDVQLPAEVMIVAACNPVSEATGAYDLSPAAANRFTHVEFRVNPRRWAKEFPSYWGGQYPEGVDVQQLGGESNWLKARSLIAGFISSRPHLLCKVPETWTDRPEDMPWPSPRTWDLVSRMVAYRWARGRDFDIEDVASRVGEGAAIEFMEWKRSFDLPDPEDLLRDPSKFKIFERNDQNYAVLSSVVAAVLNDLTEDRWKAAWEILLKAGREIPDTAAVPAGQLAAVYQKVPYYDVPEEIYEVFGPVLPRRNESMTVNRR